jgi:hypothetical protein
MKSEEVSGAKRDVDSHDTLLSQFAKGEISEAEFKKKVGSMGIGDIRQLLKDDMARIFSEGILRSSQRPTSRDAVIDSVVQSMMARQTSLDVGTFETGEKNPQRILCSDDACPCSDAQPLVIGHSAYLYISPAVVDFRKRCRTLLERDIMLEQGTKRLGADALLVDGGVA